MESNLFIAVSEEQQEVVAGGFVFDTGSFFNAGQTTKNTALTFLGTSTSTANGTATGAGFTYNNAELSQYLANGGGTKITQALSA
ncbi:MAG: CTB family bacteriocin [Rhizonema sp. PD37]|nr:CTB family bacteriocin [Rhizonema sp. PD37]